MVGSVGEEKVLYVKYATNAKLSKSLLFYSCLAEVFVNDKNKQTSHNCQFRSYLALLRAD